MLLEGCINVLHYGLRHPVLTDDDDGLHVMRLGPKPAQLPARSLLMAAGVTHPVRVESRFRIRRWRPIGGATS